VSPSRHTFCHHRCPIQTELWQPRLIRRPGAILEHHRDDVCAEPHIHRLFPSRIEHRNAASSRSSRRPHEDPNRHRCRASRDCFSHIGRHQQTDTAKRTTMQSTVSTRVSVSIPSPERATTAWRLSHRRSFLFSIEYLPRRTKSMLPGASQLQAVSPPAGCRRCHLAAGGRHPHQFRCGRRRPLLIGGNRNSGKLCKVVALLQNPSAAVGPGQNAFAPLPSFAADSCRPSCFTVIDHYQGRSETIFPCSYFLCPFGASSWASLLLVGPSIRV
jgi:hypothetical protein